MNAMPKPNHQPSRVLRVSTIALILSVTDAKVWPGAMTGTARGRLNVCVRFL